MNVEDEDTAHNLGDPETGNEQLIIDSTALDEEADMDAYIVHMTEQAFTHLYVGMTLRWKGSIADLDQKIVTMDREKNLCRETAKRA